MIASDQKVACRAIRPWLGLYIDKLNNSCTKAPNVFSSALRAVYWSIQPASFDRFDAALAVHVVYFWRDPVPELREIRRTLRPGGRLLLGYRPRDERTQAELPASVYAMRTAEEIEALFASCGFAGVRSHERAIGGARFALTEGRRPETD